ncbi:hypothetical protein CC85DRAFT_331431 [Cutaneotrichosporon oleaginosum]|uniref:S-adenosyl-L-methionine dependent methyltransferase n=1 Tax=Cutaneotrichosporon oleaginosum TaxID=879819 RepID=A0A0J0XC46_9TREE|nr:uncharacterized protein CC85DRAFT_331431 [Cutaneotrichosporon oleaginosum]KLT38635.1 hypothetical protein CC85DRAFT_331431 [Cutaneotrichosporon oleaginosum]
MHPKNPYNDARPDFAVLAGKYAELKPFVRGNNIDFTDAAALRALTTVLLKEDFDLDVRLREDRLCPTVANRLDYVLLCLDLAGPGPVRAIDIGTGHVAIYALLVHRLRPDVHMTATELDATSLAHARETVAANKAGGSINVIAAPEGRIFPLPAAGEDLDGAEYAFTMCNPPFFASAAEVEASRARKAGPAPAAPTAAANEEVTRGGEEAFVGAMIAESRGLPVRWFTSLVGRYESLHALVRRVREVTDNYYVVSLRQARTARWVLIWGYGKERLPDSMTRPAMLDPTTSFARLLPPPNTFSIKPDPPRTRAEIAGVVFRALEECGLWSGAGARGGAAATCGGSGKEGIGAASSETEPAAAAEEAGAPEVVESSRRNTGDAADDRVERAPDDRASDDRATDDRATDERAIKDGADEAISTDDQPHAHDPITLAPMANTWSRAARRAAQRGEAPALASEPLFRARLRITGSDAGEVSLDWEWGEREAVDGFWKYVLSKSGLLKLLFSRI